MRPSLSGPSGAAPLAMGCRWMTTAPHAAAAQAGASVLRDGGSAADAAVAMASTLAVVYPHMTGIGGDLFALYHDARSGETVAYNGSGAAAARATIERYRASGHAAIPERGPLAALTVPGAVDGWFALHQRFGRLDFPRLLADAIALARDGVPVARSVAASLREERAALDADAGARETFPGLDIGRRLVQPALGRTLERIASLGRAWYYEGEGAAAIGDHCRSIGSPLRAADFAAHRGEWTTPVQSKFRGSDSLTTPPNSQGVTMLIAQNVFEAFEGDARPADCSAPFVHAAVEATKIAYAERDRHVGDPRRTDPPTALLLSADFARAGAASIQPEQAAEVVAPRDAGGTTYFACVDGDGNAASVIQSIYLHFGSAVVVPELGVTLHDRGCWFTLDEGGPRSLAPGVRPFHTLMANMLVRDREPWLIYGSMGGDGQPQIGLSLSIRIAERGADPAAATRAPRWRWGTSVDGSPPNVAVERRVGDACVAGLRARGHRVDVLGDYEESMGHAGAIVIDRERGALLGASDPRSDGAAIGM